MPNDPTDPDKLLLEQFRIALSKIAVQKTTDELSFNEGRNADFEHAYDTMIDIARGAFLGGGE